jgi:hypothetical protein
MTKSIGKRPLKKAKWGFACKIKFESSSLEQVVETYYTYYEFIYIQEEETISSVEGILNITALRL